MGLQEEKECPGCFLFHNSTTCSMAHMKNEAVTEKQKFPIETVAELLGGVAWQVLHDWSRDSRVRQSFWGSCEDPREAEQPRLAAAHRRVPCRGEARGRQDPCSLVAPHRCGGDAGTIGAVQCVGGHHMQGDSHCLSHCCGVPEQGCTFSNTSGHKLLQVPKLWINACFPEQ